MKMEPNEPMTQLMATTIGNSHRRMYSSPSTLAVVVSNWENSLQARLTYTAYLKSSLDHARWPLPPSHALQHACTVSRACHRHCLAREHRDWGRACSLQECGRSSMRAQCGGWAGPCLVFQKKPWSL